MALALYGAVRLAILIARLLVGGSALVFFTNWAGIYHIAVVAAAAALGFRYHGPDDARLVPLVLAPLAAVLAWFVALFSSFIFILGSHEYETALSKHNMWVVALVNGWVHLVPVVAAVWLVRQNTGVTGDSSNNVYTRTHHRFACVAGAAILLVYLLWHPIGATYGIQLPEWSLWLMGGTWFAASCWLVARAMLPPPTRSSHSSSSRARGAE